MAGQRREGKGGDKVSGCFGHDDLDLSPAFDEQSGKCGRLVGGNAAAYAEQNTTAIKHVLSPGHLILVFLYLLVVEMQVAMQVFVGGNNGRIWEPLVVFRDFNLLLVFLHLLNGFRLGGEIL
jgi:hypothetical protein